MKLYREKELCCGCGACMDACPVDAVRMTEDGEGFFYPQADAAACIRCGRCVKACPCHLVPQKMWEACKHYNYDLFQKLYGMECYECGSCTFVCPARLSLTQSFKQARMMVFDQRKNIVELKAGGAG